MALSRRSLLRAAGATALAGIPALAACGAPTGTSTGRLRVAFAGAGGLGVPDPHHVWRPVDRSRAAAVADTLLVWGQDMAPVPHLAASVGPDRTGTRWRVRLREAIAHDGRPLTSADVLASLRRVLAPETGATAAPLLTHLDLTASRALSATELELVLSTPDFLFPLVLGSPGTGIVRDGRGDRPIGTGAWKTAGRAPAVLTRHDGHWLGAAYATELEYRVDDDEDNRYQALVDGQIDYAHDLFPHSARRLMGRTATAIVSTPGASTRFLRAEDGGADDGPLADPRLLEAIRLGLDRDELVRTVLLDLGTPGDDLFGAGLAGHRAGAVPVVRDLDRARALAAAAGARGTTLPLVFDPLDPLSRPTATVAAEQLDAVGVHTEPREPEGPDADPVPGIRFRRVPAQPIPLYLRAAAGPAGEDDERASRGASAGTPGTQLGPLLTTAARTPDEQARAEALGRAQELLRATGTVWADCAENVGISAELSGVEPARPDTGTWARFHRVRRG